jgi:hypothetical protein
MPEDAIELPEYGDASAPTDAAGEAGHAVDSSTLSESVRVRLFMKNETRK